MAGGKGGEGQGSARRKRGGRARGAEGRAELRARAEGARVHGAAAGRVANRGPKHHHDPQRAGRGRGEEDGQSAAGHPRSRARHYHLWGVWLLYRRRPGRQAEGRPGTHLQGIHEGSKWRKILLRDQVADCVGRVGHEARGGHLFPPRVWGFPESVAAIRRVGAPSEQR